MAGTEISGASLAGVLDVPVPKRFRRGTHRAADADATLARVRPHMARMGITRIGNITGLDRIGIPVAVAVRPNARSISVSQGKGLDLPQAMASALMEACEGYHAEEALPGKRAAYGDLAARAAVADPAALPAAGRPFDPAAVTAWHAGWDLLRGERCWLPAEIVHTDYTCPLDGYFLAGSNGLAAGNHPAEALIAALCELIERDAVALWHAEGVRRQAGRAIDPASVDDPDCRALLNRYERVGIAVRLWNATTDIAVPVFICQIRDPAPGDPHRLRRFQGSGCHPDRGIALLRALTEAAQTRLTYIAGIRDDLLPARYDEPPHGDIADALYDALARQGRPVAFADVPGTATDDLTEDLRHLLRQLRAAGIDRVVAVDLTGSEIGIPVVRVVVPGLEGDPKHPSYHPGPRARRAAAA